MTRPVNTHLALFAQFLDSVKELTTDIESVNAALEERDDYDEVTQFHNTKRLIQRWLDRNGNMVI